MWEYHQFKIDFQYGSPSNSCYNTNSKKGCICHHPHHQAVLSTAKSTDDDLLSDGGMKNNAKTTDDDVISDNGKKDPARASQRTRS